MQASQPSIFRASAYERFLESSEETILPRFVNRKRLRWLWALLVLLLAGSTLAWSTRVPLFTRASATVVELPERGWALLVFLDAREPHELKVGSQLFLHLDERAERLVCPVLALDSGPSAPALLRERFGLTELGAQRLTRPAIAVVARFNPAPEAPQAALYRGAWLSVDVPSAEVPLLSLLPWVGGWFERTPAADGGASEDS